MLVAAGRGLHSCRAGTRHAERAKPAERPARPAERASESRAESLDRATGGRAAAARRCDTSRRRAARDAAGRRASHVALRRRTAVRQRGVRATPRRLRTALEQTTPCGDVCSRRPGDG